MIDRVSTFIKDFKLEGKTVLVGFSGGCDSMSLLDIMRKISPKYGITLVAVHYNHNWRGQTAKQEQENCRNYCEKYGIEFYTETAPDNIKQNETEARELRYAFFERAIEKYDADAVFTAHNYNDNAETILYRISKGTGIVGLQGILPKRGKYYRPVLDIKRDEIEQYCKENNLSPNIDDSNEDRVHKRNLIRHDILPLLSEINPDIIKSLNSLGKISISEEEIVGEYLSKINKDLFDGEKIKTKEFLKLSNPVQQRIIYNLIYESEFDYTMDTILNVYNFIKTTIKENKPSKFSLGKNNWLYVDSNIIEIISETPKTTDEIALNCEGEYVLGNSVFLMEKCEEFFKTKDEAQACVNLSGYSDLTLRTRRDGDVIQPLGSEGKMKLKKYFMSKKIPQHRRDEYLLLADKNEILWVAGIGLSDKIKVSDKPTHKLTVKKL